MYVCQYMCGLVCFKWKHSLQFQVHVNKSRMVKQVLCQDKTKLLATAKRKQFWLSRVLKLHKDTKLALATIISCSFTLAHTVWRIVCKLPQYMYKCVTMFKTCTPCYELHMHDKMHETGSRMGHWISTWEMVATQPIGGYNWGATRTQLIDPTVGSSVAISWGKSRVHGCVCICI